MQTKKIKDRDTLKWIIKSVKNQFPAVFLLIISNAVLSFLGVVFAFKCSTVIDAANTFDKKGLISGLLILLLLITSQIVIRIIGQNIAVRVSAKTEILFKSKLFSNILKKDYSKITAFHSGDLMTRLTSDISIMSDGIITLAPTVVAMITRLVFAATGLILLDPSFAFLFMIAGILILLVTSFFRTLMKKLHKKIQETDGILRSFLQESIGGILMIKVFGIEDKINEKAKIYQNNN